MTIVAAEFCDTAGSGTLPPWVPSAGQVGIVPATNTIADIDPCPQDNCVYSLTSGISSIFSFSGGAVADDYGSLGAIIITGGGHDDYGGNQVIAFLLDTLTWIALDTPSTDPKIADVPNTCDPLTGALDDGQPISSHTYDGLQILPPSLGGGSNGYLVLPKLSAAGRQAAGYAKAWYFDLDQPIPAVTRWQRYGTVTTSALAGVPFSALDTVRGGIWHTGHNQQTSMTFLSAATREFQTFTGLTSFGSTAVDSNVMFYHAQRDVLVMVCRVSATNASLKVRYLVPGFPPSGWFTPNVIGDPFPTSVSNDFGGEYCPDNGKIYFIMRPEEAIWELSLPDPALPIVSDWTLTRISLTDSATAYWDAGEAVTRWESELTRAATGPYKRFSYHRKVKCYLFARLVEGSSSHPADTLVLSFRPTGT